MKESEKRPGEMWRNSVDGEVLRDGFTGRKPFLCIIAASLLDLIIKSRDLVRAVSEAEQEWNPSDCRKK